MDSVRLASFKKKKGGREPPPPPPPLPKKKYTKMKPTRAVIHLPTFTGDAADPPPPLAFVAFANSAASLAGVTLIEAPEPPVLFSFPESSDAFRPSL